MQESLILSPLHSMHMLAVSYVLSKEEANHYQSSLPRRAGLAYVYICIFICTIQNLNQNFITAQDGKYTRNASTVHLDLCTVYLVYFSYVTLFETVIFLLSEHLSVCFFFSTEHIKMNGLMQWYSSRLIQDMFSLNNSCDVSHSDRFSSIFFSCSRQMLGFGHYHILLNLFEIIIHLSNQFILYSVASESIIK